MLIQQGKANIKYIFIVIIVAVFAGGIIIGASKLMGYTFWWPSFHEIVIKDDVVNEVEGWQTYSNEEYGFEIKYPQDWTIIDSCSNPFFSDENCVSIIQAKDYGEASACTICISADKDLYEKCLNLFPGSSENVNFAGIEAIKNPSVAEMTINYCFQKNNRYFTIFTEEPYASPHANPEDSALPECPYEQENKILSTFKFLDKDEKTVLDNNCDSLPANLDSCSKYKCSFIHPFTGEIMTREITGIVDGKCNYVEAMPMGSKMECNYTEEIRRAVAQYYTDTMAAESVGVQVEGNINSPNITYTINGKEVENPLQEAMNNGDCIIFDSSGKAISVSSGQDDNIVDVEEDELEINFFYSPTCSHCKNEKAFLEELMPQCPDVKLNQYNLSESQNKTILNEFFDDYQVPEEKRGYVPVTFIGEEYFIGFGATTQEALEAYCQ